MNGSLAANETLVQALRMGLTAGRPAGWRCACPRCTWPRCKCLLAGSGIDAGCGRICRPHDRGPTPARCRPACCASSAAAIASLATPSAASITRRADAAGGDSRRSSALARWHHAHRVRGRNIWPSARPARTEEVVKRQLAAVVHMQWPLHQRDCWWPTSRCGPSALAGRPAPEQAQAVHALLRAQLQAATAACRSCARSCTVAA